MDIKMAGSVTDLSSFTFLSHLGKGGYGRVYLVRKEKGLDKGNLYALKRIVKETIDEEERHTALTEMNVMKAVRDAPFLVGVEYAFQSNSCLNFVMELAAGGDIIGLKRKHKFTETQLRFYLAELVLAVGALHDRLIMHRDIKPANVFIDSAGHILLGDFGMSKQFLPSDKIRYVHQVDGDACYGTTCYIAPEVLMGDNYGFAADWYSVGATAYDILTGNPPHHVSGDNGHSEMEERMAQGPVDIPEGLSPALKDLLTQLMVMDPEMRLGAILGAGKIKRHAFFKDVNWVRIQRKQVPPPFLPDLMDGADPDLVEKPLEVPLDDDPTLMEEFRDFNYQPPTLDSQDVQLSPRKGIKRKFQE